MMFDEKKVTDLTLKKVYRCDTLRTMTTFTKVDVLKMSVTERIQLVEDIWDTIAEVPEQVELTDAQKPELDRRLVAYHKNPGEGSPWSVVKERIRSKM